MTKDKFLEGWTRLLAAFDVKKSTDHMKIVWENVRAFSDTCWPIAIENIIKEENRFPAIATIRQYLLDTVRERRVAVSKPMENEEPVPAWYANEIVEIFNMPHGPLRDARRRSANDRLLREIKNGSMETLNLEV